jgi:hypothetical protein
MTIGSVRHGDVLRCDVRGDHFWARAIGEVTDGKVQIEALNGRPIPALRVTARQIIGHWRMRKGSAL